MYGRLPLFHASTFLFVVFNIACAVSTSLNQLIVFRFFAGSFGAAVSVSSSPPDFYLLTTLLSR